MWSKKFARYLLYQKPEPIATVFHPGAAEDRPGDAGNRPQEAGKGEQDGGEDQSEGKRSGAKHGSEKPGNSRKKRGGAGGGARPRRVTKKKKNGSSSQDEGAETAESRGRVEEILVNEVELAYDLDENRRVLAEIFRVPQNKDAVLRSLSIGTDPPVRALLVFIDGVTDSQVQNLAVLQPLMLLPGLRCVREDGEPGAAGGDGDLFKDLFDRVKEALLPNNQVSVAETYSRVAEDVLSGNSALLIDGFNQALLLETKGWHFRSVSTPQVEAVIRGPQEAFTEQIRINTSLVRKIIRRPSLVTEFVKVGGSAPMQCAIMYLADLANPDLVREVKRRLGSVRADFVQETGLVEQFIEDSPWHPAPQVLATERPDRVAANILEGKVAVIVDGNPFVMVIPCTFFALMQAPEDAYVRWPFGSFVRAIRYLALFMAMLLPAHYVAIVAFHQEFIPTDLLLVMTGAREKVPFPSIVEVLVMEISFELIREAGIRIPGTVGTTLGIVGALILGQAAVAANIVSPILIIVVAVTALGSFAIPNYSFSLSVRILRFIYIILGATMGLLGILVGFFIHVGMLVHLKSFGVPYMAPAAPVTRKSMDYFMRGPAWTQETRPDYIDPLKTRRQPRLSRGWLRPGGNNGGTGKQ